MAKQIELIGNYTRLVDTMNLSGYVVKPEHILRLVDTIKNCELFQGGLTESFSPNIAYHIFLKDGGVIQLKELNELIKYPNTQPEIIEGLRISCQGENDKSIKVKFDDRGRIIIDACGPSLIVDIVIHNVNRQLRALDQDYSWFVRRFIVSSYPRKLAMSIVAGAAFVLVYYLGMYLYALSVGVNINPELIPTGMTYYQQIEAAIRAENVSEKLNVLLLGNLRGFMNLTDYLQRTRTYIIGALLIIFILGFASWISSYLKRLFPRSFFALGYQQEVLSRMEKKREIWIVVIIIGFLVNVIAGILVAVLGIR